MQTILIEIAASLKKQLIHSSLTLEMIGAYR